MDRSRGAHRTFAGVALILGLAALAVAGCSAPAASTSTLAIADAWVRPAAVGGTSAAYLTISNTGDTDTLLAVRCSIAGNVMIHETTTDGSGMTGMSMIASLSVPAKTSVTLKPGGTHVMMTGLTRPIAAGEKLELQLVFERAGVITIAAAVRAG